VSTDAAPALSVVGASRLRSGSGGTAFLLEVPRFYARRGECIAVTGASGSGKSTLLELLGLVLRPDTCEAFQLRVEGGELVVDVARLWQQSDHTRLARVRARYLGYVLQTGGLLPFLTAIENIRLSLSVLGLPERGSHVDMLVDALGIEHLLARKPQALSIGERQRVAIARALAHGPAILLADEPTAALDPGQARQVMQLLLALVARFAVTAIVVSHDWQLMRAFSLREVSAEPVLRAAKAHTRFTG
jgi:putative ABC transport system ATP-binding protein